MNGLKKYKIIRTYRRLVIGEGGRDVADGYPDLAYAASVY